MASILEKIEAHLQTHRIQSWEGAFISARSSDTEQVRKLNEVVETLVSREKYCSECANELLKYVSSLLAREK